MEGLEEAVRICRIIKAVTYHLYHDWHTYTDSLHSSRSSNYTTMLEVSLTGVPVETEVSIGVDTFTAGMFVDAHGLSPRPLLQSKSK